METGITFLADVFYTLPERHPILLFIIFGLGIVSYHFWQRWFPGVLPNRQAKLVSVFIATGVVAFFMIALVERIAGDSTRFKKESAQQDSLLQPKAAQTQTTAAYSPAGISVLFQSNPDKLTVAIPLHFINAQMTEEGKKKTDFMNRFDHALIKTAEPGTRDFELEVEQGIFFGSGKLLIKDIFSIPAVNLGKALVRLEFPIVIPREPPVVKPGPSFGVFPITVLHQLKDTYTESNQSLDAILQGAGEDLAYLAARIFPNNENLHQGFLDQPTVEGIKEDQKLLKQFDSAYLEGKHCIDFHKNPSLCLIIEWKNGSAVQQYFDDLILTAPRGMGHPGFMFGFDRQREFLRKKSPRKEVTKDYSFPAGINLAGYDTGDMALFGGLLCLSGEEEGCLLLKCSQDPSGQFFRSPANWQQESTTEHSSFSGDQFLGVIAFMIGSKTQNPCPIRNAAPMTTKERLNAFVKFVSGNKHYYPSPNSRLDFGYKSCIEKSDKQDCLLQGSEWFWLNFLSKKENISAAIPSDSQDVEKRYGFDWSHLEWKAAFAPLGNETYQLHLVGVQLYLAQKSGITHASIKRAAAILASRQPENPFFLYLHLGRDRRVADQIRTKCVDQYPKVERFEWAWQSVERKRMWEKSMGWDCVFMLNNMLKH